MTDKVIWQRQPIVEPLDIRTVWYHIPLDYYRYGEYPRWVTPIGPPNLPWKWVKVYERNVRK